MRPDEAWPALIAAQQEWRLTDLAVSGSGFVKAGWNGTTYRQQVDAALKLHPDIVLIAATRNDRYEDLERVASAADDLLGALRHAFPRARFIGITGVWGSNQPPPTMSAVDAVVEKAVDGVGGVFLDLGFPLVGRPGLVQPDGIHPNAAGQRTVARAIEEQLSSPSVTL